MGFAEPSALSGEGNHSLLFATLPKVLRQNCQSLKEFQLSGREQQTHAVRVCQLLLAPYHPPGPFDEFAF
ncbi:hypothetical protein STEG23_010047 [Scotinomys teguina]